MLQVIFKQEKQDAEKAARKLAKEARAALQEIRVNRLALPVELVSLNAIISPAAIAETCTQDIIYGHRACAWAWAWAGGACRQFSWVWLASGLFLRAAC